MYLNAIAELGGTYQGGKIHLANREDDEKARTATEDAQFSAENTAESVDESGELRYNRRTTIDEKAGTDYLIHNFSGEVKYDPQTLPMSDQELAVVSQAVKTGWGKLNTSNKYGYVFSSKNYYAFIYNSDNSITVSRRLDIDTHREVINIARGIVEGDTSTKRKIGDLRSWLTFIWNGRAGYRYNADDGVQQLRPNGSPDPMDGSTRGSHNGGDLGRSSADRQNGQLKFNQDGRKATLTVNGETLNSIGKPVYFNDAARLP